MLDGLRGGEDVVGVQEADDVASGHLPTLVHAVVDALVGFTDPFGVLGKAGMLGGELFEQLAGSVAGASVDDDVLDVRIRLSKHALDGAWQHTGRTKRHRDDGDADGPLASANGGLERRVARRVSGRRVFGRLAHTSPP